MGSQRVGHDWVTFIFNSVRELSLRVNRRVTFTYTVGARLYFPQISDMYIFNFNFNGACACATSGPQLLGKTILTLIVHVTSFSSTSGLWTTPTLSRRSRLRRLFPPAPTAAATPIQSNLERCLATLCRPPERTETEKENAQAQWWTRVPLSITQSAEEVILVTTHLTCSDRKP